MKNTYTLEPFLTSNKLSTQEKQTLFKLRTRMIDVKTNFKSKHGQDLSCRLCPVEENQAHLLSCKEIIECKTTYDNIFWDLKKQEEIAKIYTQILKTRSTKIRILSQWEPGALCTARCLIYTCFLYMIWIQYIYMKKKIKNRLFGCIKKSKNTKGASWYLNKKIL